MSRDWRIAITRIGSAHGVAEGEHGFEPLGDPTEILEISRRVVDRSGIAKRRRRVRNVGTGSPVDVEAKSWVMGGADSSVLTGAS